MEDLLSNGRGGLAPVRHRVVDESFEAMFPDLTKFSAGSVNDREGRISARAAADVATLQGRRAVKDDAA